MAPTEKQRLAQVIQLLRERLTSKKHKRESVEKQLRNALQLYFDADMEERVAELDKVKAHLAEMEAKLQRRLESDREIIDLQLKQMLHKADGLEFSIPVSGGSVGGSSGAGYGDGMEGYGGEGGMGGMMGGYGEGGGELGGSGGSEGMAGMTMRPSGDIGDGASALGAFGYDCSHGFTAMRRVDVNELEDEDPLKQYLQAEEKIDTEGAELQSLDDAGKMEKLLLAMHMFTSRFGHFPRSESRQMTNQPPHSWRVAILPLIGYGELYQQYHFNEPWDSPANMRLVNQMPEFYRSTRDPKEDSTRFQIVVGEGAFDSGTAPARMADITDGSPTP